MINPTKTQNQENENVSKAAGVVGFYTLLSRILGLIRDIVVAKYFGSGAITDAFFVAFRIPNLLRRFTAEGSLSIAFVPVFTEYIRTKSWSDAIELARVAFTLLSVILAVMAITGVLFAPWIVRIQAWGFGEVGTRYELTVLLTRITFPYIFLISLVALFMGILNSMRHFAAPSAAPIFLNVGIIGAILLISPHFSQPIIGAAIGVIIGGMLQVGLQVPIIIKKGVSLIPKWKPDHPALRKIGLLMLPTIFGSAVYQINQFIGTLLASFLTEGSVSWLYYADRLVQFPLGVFAIAISTAALPSLSSQAVEKDQIAFSDTINHSLGLTFFMAIPSMTGLIILGEPIIRLFFQRGDFNQYSTIMTSQALLFYSIGVWAFSGIRVIVSGFYALQDTKTPVYIATISLVINLFLSLLLMRPLKHGGLALALSIASCIQFCILVLMLKRKISIWNFMPILVTVAKTLVASILMGLTIGFFHLMGYSQSLFGLIVIIIAGAFIYFIIAHLLGCRELSIVYDLFKKYLNHLLHKNSA